jgi:hypothetical protein
MMAERRERRERFGDAGGEATRAGTTTPSIVTHWREAIHAARSRGCYVMVRRAAR